MLSAFDKETDAPLNLPDFEGPAEITTLRTWTKTQRVVCPTCKGELVVRAGELRVAHFAHKALKDCPHSNNSQLVVATRTFLYRFFSSRLGPGKIEGAKVLLEVDRPDLLDRPLDIVVERPGRRTDVVLCVEKRLPVDVRGRVARHLSPNDDICFLPVFLQSPKKGEEPNSVFLTPDMAEFLKVSPFNAFPEYKATVPGTLHFCDILDQKWNCYRGLNLVHDPRGYRFEANNACKLDELRWSERYADFTTAREAESGKELIRRFEEGRRPWEEIISERVKEAAFGHQRPLLVPSAPRSDVPRQIVHPRVARFGKLRCKGCGKESAHWTVASPNHGLCVCRECFGRGIRLR